MAGTEVKFGEWIEKGFKLYKDNFGLLVLASLIAVLISAVTFGILAGPLMAGMFLITLDLIDGKEPKPDAGMVFKGFNYFLNAFLFVLLWGVLMFVVSFLLSFIPCIGSLIALFLVYSAQTLLMFGLFFIVEDKMEFWPASMKSIEKVKENFWPFLGFFVVISIIGSIGAVLCGIGIILTFPIQICALTVAYRDIFKKTPPPLNS